MRTIDDSIVYKLNTSVPTLSFSDQISGSEQCKSLYEQVMYPSLDRDHRFLFLQGKNLFT